MYDWVFSLYFIAYIDPGSGLPFASGLALFLGIGATFLSILLLFLKRILRFLKRNYKVIIGIILIILFLLGLKFFIGRDRVNKVDKKFNRVIILGVDALDYSLVKEYLAEGELPNFKRLAEKGVFSSLQTVCPPESNVVWISFATGMNPGNHGIFDFIMRNPENYHPYLSLYEIKNSKFSLKPGFKNRRKALAFWEIATDNKIPSYSYFAPNSFPPDKVSGELISGMGVPDIRGTMGTFSFYTTRNIKDGKDTGGLVFKVEKDKGIINTFLHGPRNTLASPPEDAEIPFTVEFKDANSVNIKIQEQSFVLKKGQWSDWARVVFKINFLNKVRGICRFYLKSIEPFELYCSPVNFDPESPLHPLSSPSDLTAGLAGEVGLFYTQGMPYDTWALNENRINEDEFLEHCRYIFNERKKILELKLSEFKKGIFFFYFEYPDVIQHMFWKDKDNPDSPYRNVVKDCYKKMDELLGRVLDDIDKDTTLIVLSDHGFGDFDKAVHLNSWLRKNGYLCLKDNSKKSGEFFENVDWTKTKAYALGLGSIYINRKGREAKGIVSAAEASKIKEEIIQGLQSWKDASAGKPVVSKVYRKENAFTGKHNFDAPDLFAGFNIGYRASWQTALGAVPADLMEDNKKNWDASHIFDPVLVPGVFFMNRKVGLRENIRVVDIIPTVFDILNIKQAQDFDGSSILR